MKSIGRTLSALFVLSCSCSGGAGTSPDGAVPLDASAAAAPTSCTTCVLTVRRTDILPFYKANGWNTKKANWNRILLNWCGIDPHGCRQELNQCAACGSFAPANSCTSCVIYNRDDILPFFRSNGWSSDMDKWDGIIREWCRIDPVGCGLERVKPQCKQPCKDNFSTELVTSLATYLHDESNWNTFIDGQGVWNPLTNGDMPCQTYVSWVWYLSDVMSMETELIAPGNRQYGWEGLYWYSDDVNGTGTRWTWVIGFHDFMGSKAPSLVSSEVETTNSASMASLESSMRVGDVVQYFGNRSDCGACWKHSVLVHKIRSDGKPLVASFGYPPVIDVPWDALRTPPYSDFDFTKVRVIHRPSPPLP